MYAMNRHFLHYIPAILPWDLFYTSLDINESIFANPPGPGHQDVSTNSFSMALFFNRPKTSLKVERCTTSFKIKTNRRQIFEEQTSHHKSKVRNWFFSPFTPLRFWQRQRRRLFKVVQGKGGRDQRIIAERKIAQSANYPFCSPRQTNFLQSPKKKLSILETSSQMAARDR